MRSLPFILLMTLLSTVIQAQKASEHHLLIGTYSVKDNTNGIYVYRFNSQTGEFNTEQPVTELANASYLAISADGKNVYAVSEAGGGKGSVHAYAFNPSNGALTFLNSVL